MLVGLDELETMSVIQFRASTSYSGIYIIFKGSVHTAYIYTRTHAWSEHHLRARHHMTGQMDKIMPYGTVPRSGLF